MKKLIYLILISFCLFSPLQSQDVILPFSKILSWLDADSIHCRVFYADSVIAGVVITNYSYLSADSIITASFTVWDTTTGFKFVDFQGVQRKAFIDSLGVRELTVTDSAYIDTLTTAILRVIGKAVVEDSFRVNKTSRFIGSSTFGATATPLQILTTGDIRGLSTAGHRLRMDAIGATLNQTKSLLLENQTAAAAGAQQISPALIFRGNGWGTTAPASDSVKWAIYTLPIQGTTTPKSYLYFSSKLGSVSWGNNIYVTSDGASYAYAFSSSQSLASEFYQSPIFSSTGNTIISADNNNTSSDGIIRFGRGATTPTTEYARFLHTGELGIGTTAPGSKLEVWGNKSADTLFSVYNDKTGLTARDSSFVVLPTGQTNVSVTGSAIGLSVDGNKTIGNLFQVINDNDGAVGDSSFTIDSKGVPFVRNTSLGYAVGYGAALSLYGTNVFFKTNQGANGGIGLSSYNQQDITFWTAGNGYTFSNERMRIKDAGEVGIGTSAPGSKLDVKGAASGSVSSDTTFSVFNDRYRTAATRDTTFDIMSNGNVHINNAVRYVRVVSLADGAQHLLPTGKAGFGKVSCNSEFATFYFTTAGAVSLVTAGTAGLTSANVTTTEDNDTTLNIFDDGSGIGIENELGNTYNVLIDITYYTP